MNGLELEIYYSCSYLYVYTIVKSRIYKLVTRTHLQRLAFIMYVNKYSDNIMISFRHFLIYSRPITDKHVKPR